MLKNIQYFKVFRLPIFIASIKTDFHHWKYFMIILLFFLYSVVENKFVYSNKLYLLTWNQQIQCNIMHTILNCKLVCYKDLLEYFFPMNFLISFGICSK